MPDKIFIRVGAWYRASAKQIPTDLEITDVVDDPALQYPEVVGDGEEGGGTTLYTGDGTLAENRTVEGNGKILSIFRLAQYYVGGTIYEDVFGFDDTDGTAIMGDSQTSVNGTLVEVKDNLGVIRLKAANGVGIGIGRGSNVPHPSAILELKSTTKGFLLPRMSTVERDSIDSPEAGLLIFNTETNSINWFAGGWNTGLTQDIVIAGTGTLSFTNGLLTAFTPE